jgi:hypothetical protein
MGVRLFSMLTAPVKDAHGNLARMQLRLQVAMIEQARLGKRVVVVMDEAQNLDHLVLEVIRMLCKRPKFPSSAEPGLGLRLVSWTRQRDWCENGGFADGVRLPRSVESLS